MKKFYFSVFIFSLLLSISVSAFAASSMINGFIGNYKLEGYNTVGKDANNHVYSVANTSSYTMQGGIWTTTNIDEISTTAIIFVNDVLTAMIESGNKNNVYTADARATDPSVYSSSNVYKSRTFHHAKTGSTSWNQAQDLNY